MSNIGRSVKIIEAPRPLKLQSITIKDNFMLVEELIQLIEHITATLESGNNIESMSTLTRNLRIHGPHLETISKDTLDRAFIIFRNASLDARVNIMIRLNLLELIELRAKGWKDNGSNAYYKIKATNTELHNGQPYINNNISYMGSTSFGILDTENTTFIAVSSTNQEQLLNPGEVIRTSDKFSKPTNSRIPGKMYFKDEIIIRNADSGKVMGIKGRRIHLIEELSETVISFQKVNSGVKDRLVQITGPNEEKIIYAKTLIEETIRRNASPIRKDRNTTSDTIFDTELSSSITSSNSDDTNEASTSKNNNVQNSLGLTTTKNILTNKQQTVVKLPLTSTNAAIAEAAAGEYKFTCNVGEHVIKITSDCCDLVRAAKLVLDDYFSSAEFLSSEESGITFDSCAINPIPANNNNQDRDDYLYKHENNSLKTYLSNGSVRSRRSHFSRIESTPESIMNNLFVPNDQKNELLYIGGHNGITHQYKDLLYFAKSPYSKVLPAEWEKICRDFPSIIRKKPDIENLDCNMN